jgi:starch-binding outer membrane protein, SusD/RagB family
MRNSTFRRAARTALLAALVAGTGACELDLTNPNSPPEALVLTTPEGIIALAVGMQGQYAGTGVGTGMVLNVVRAQGLVTDELSTTSRALAADRSLVTGQGVDATFGVVTGPYSTAFRVIRSAEELLANAPTAGLSVGTLAGINALARTYKAMSLGNLIQLYQQVPLTATLESTPCSRGAWCWTA